MYPAPAYQLRTALPAMVERPVEDSPLLTKEEFYTSPQYPKLSPPMDDNLYPTKTLPVEVDHNSVFGHGYLDDVVNPTALQVANWASMIFTEFNLAEVLLCARDELKVDITSHLQLAVVKLMGKIGSYYLQILRGVIEYHEKNYEIQKRQATTAEQFQNFPTPNHAPGDVHLPSGIGTCGNLARSDNGYYPIISPITSCESFNLSPLYVREIEVELPKSSTPKNFLDDQVNETSDIAPINNKFRDSPWETRVSNANLDRRLQYGDFDSPIEMAKYGYEYRYEREISTAYPKSPLYQGNVQSTVLPPNEILLNPTSRGCGEFYEPCELEPRVPISPNDLYYTAKNSEYFCVSQCHTNTLGNALNGYYQTPQWHSNDKIGIDVGSTAYSRPGLIGDCQEMMRPLCRWANDHAPSPASFSENRCPRQIFCATLKQKACTWPNSGEEIEENYNGQTLNCYRTRVDNGINDGFDVTYFDRMARAAGATMGAKVSSAIKNSNKPDRMHKNRSTDEVVNQFPRFTPHDLYAESRELLPYNYLAEPHEGIIEKNFSPLSAKYFQKEKELSYCPLNSTSSILRSQRHGYSSSPGIVSVSHLTNSSTSKNSTCSENNPNGSHLIQNWGIVSHISDLPSSYSNDSLDVATALEEPYISSLTIGGVKNQPSKHTVSKVSIATTADDSRSSEALMTGNKIFGQKLVFPKLCGEFYNRYDNGCAKDFICGSFNATFTGGITASDVNVVPQRLSTSSLPYDIQMNFHTETPTLEEDETLSHWNPEADSVSLYDEVFDDDDVSDVESSSSESTNGIFSSTEQSSCLSDSMHHGSYLVGSPCNSSRSVSIAEPQFSSELGENGSPFVRDSSYLFLHNEFSNSLASIANPIFSSSGLNGDNRAARKTCDLLGRDNFSCNDCEERSDVATCELLDHFHVRTSLDSLDAVGNCRMPSTRIQHCKDFLNAFCKDVYDNAPFCFENVLNEALSVSTRQDEGSVQHPTYCQNETHENINQTDKLERTVESEVTSQRTTYLTRDVSNSIFRSQPLALSNVGSDNSCSQDNQNCSKPSGDESTATGQDLVSEVTAHIALNPYEYEEHHDCIKVSHMSLPVPKMFYNLTYDDPTIASASDEAHLRVFDYSNMATTLAKPHGRSPMTNADANTAVSKVDISHLMGQSHNFMTPSASLDEVIHPTTAEIVKLDNTPTKYVVNSQVRFTSTGLFEDSKPGKVKSLIRLFEKH